MNMNRQTKEVRRDLDVLAEDVQSLLLATADVAEEKVIEARKRLSAALEEGRNTFNRLQEITVDGVEIADKAVRTHPYQSIGIALGIGSLIGVLLTRGYHESNGANSNKKSAAH